MAGRNLPKTLTREEVAALIAAPNSSCPTGLRNRALLTVMYRTGLRVSETCGLGLRDVRWRDAELHIRPEVAKGGREAVLPLDPVTLALLERWKDVRRRHAAGRPHLFTTLQGGPVSRHYVWEMMQRSARRAGVETHVYPHILRHTFATELLREGFNIREVQKLMRHADIRTTTVYLHIVDTELAAKVARRGT